MESRSDLKPDNVLLDAEGHAHLTDLNIAVHVNERKMLTGVAGSMAYMGKLLYAVILTRIHLPDSSTRDIDPQRIHLHR